MVALVVRASLAAPSDALTSSIFEDAESAAWWTVGKTTPTRDPETNSKLAPENGWLEYFLVSLCNGLFSGANC